MSATLLINAQITDTPTYADLPYCYFDIPSSGDTVRKAKIDVTGYPANYVLEYSIDGTTWHLIANTLNTASYSWALTDGQQAIIFGLGEVADVIIRMTDGSDELARDDKKFSLVSFTSLTPETTKIIYENDVFLINYEELYSSGTPNIDVYMKRVSTSTWREIYSGIPINKKSLPFGFATYKDLANDYFTAGAGFYFHVMLVGTNGHSSNYVVGPEFQVTNVVQEEDPADLATYYSDEAFRMFGGRRIAAEKGELLDEAIILGQIEKAPGILISMRNNLGKLTEDPEEPVNYKKAYNLVFGIDPSTIPLIEAGREHVSRITFGTWASPLGTNVTPSPSPYANDVTAGSLRRLAVNHDFDLVSPGHIHVEIQPITDHTLTTDVYPESSTLAVWEVLDKDSIYVYAVLRDPSGMGAGYPTNAVSYKVSIRERVNVQ